MIHRLIAVSLVLVLVGTVTPLFAGDLVDPKLLPWKTSVYRPFRIHTGMAFAPAQTAPVEQPTQTPAQRKQLTRAGRVLKWIGVGLMAEGALAIGVGAAESCSGGWDFGCQTARKVYYGFGGVSAGVGAVLFFVGIHKKE